MKVHLYIKHLLTFLVLYGCSWSIQAQISGIAYQDFNTTGIQDQNEKGIKGIIVKAYNRKGESIASSTTDSLGKYSLNVPAGKRVRIEFTNLPDGYVSTPLSFDNFGLTQFVVSPLPKNDLPLYDPDRYDDGFPRAVIASYTLGSQKNVYSDTASAISIVDTKKFAYRYKYATAAQVGSIWGLAYDKTRTKLYASAFAKRHVGYGPRGPEGLYVIDFSSGDVTPLCDKEKFSINAGLNQHTKLSTPYKADGITFELNHDTLFFDQVGKVSYGGLDVSEDGNSLYVMNLFDRALYKINLPRNGVLVQTKDLTRIDLPKIDCTTGEARPFAVKYKNGKVYVGIVCDASISQKVSDLKAYVYVMDVNTQQFTQVFSMTLDYVKGLPEVGYNSRRGWYPWTKDFNAGIVPESFDFWAIYPQPILSDIEFDNEGSMILGFMDRFGHQGGTGQPRPDNKARIITESAGDIIRVALVNGKYEVENNAKAGNITTKGANNKQGPGGGEYYYEDHFRPSKSGNPISEEAAAGGLAIIPGTGELLASHREPYFDIPWYIVHGLRVFSNQTGAFQRGYNVPSVGFTKSGGVGDIEFVSSGAVTEISQRLWSDCDEDGIQDADEPGLADMEVEIYKDGKQYSVTQTNAKGELIWNEDSLPNGSLEIGVDYEIRVPLNQVKFKNLQVTKTKIGTNPELDNDATAVDGYAVVKARLSVAGKNENTLDIGFKCFDKPTATATLECTGTSDAREAVLTVKGFKTTDKFDSNIGGTYEGDLDYNSAKAIPVKGDILKESINLYKATEFTIRLFNRYCFADYTFKTADNKQCFQQILSVEKEEELPDDIFLLFPNPASTTVQVQYKSQSGLSELPFQLIDNQGKVYQKKDVRKSNDVYITTFDLKELSPAAYYISVQDAGKRYSKKLVRVE